MSRLFALYLSLLIVLVTVQTGGCSDKSRYDAVIQKVERDAPISDNVEDLKAELRTIRARERIIEGALEDAKIDALQTKLWIGVGAAVLAGLVLVALGIWTTRRFLVELGLGAFALAALGAGAAWLVPYMIWIGAGLAVVVIGIAVYMLANREKALKQVTNAVDESKALIPQFRDQYRSIFRGHIDTAMDRVVNSVRGAK